MSERRKRDEMAPGTRSGDDRRIIERFSNPSVYSDFIQILRWVRGMACIILAGAIAKVISGVLSEKPIVIAYEVFFATFMIIFAILLFKYASSINKFLKNESVTNLEVAFEYQHEFWKSAGIFMFLFTIINFIFSY